MEKRSSIGGALGKNISKEKRGEPQGCSVGDLDNNEGGNSAKPSGASGLGDGGHRPDGDTGINARTYEDEVTLLAL
ncbi:unnamed protein product [Ilex paraguariensis]|uniref:Uncharacterized protein n=1 Tax=Ilex paraguariensis TaxID=185542 RepID=A0ABC8U8B1_9AQUA